MAGMWASLSIVFAQTRVDLRTQSKDIDFSQATITKPFATGAAQPAACTIGQTYFNTTAAVGANLQVCTSANTWTVLGTAGAAGVPNYAAAFSGQTTLTILGSSHGLGTANLVVICYDGSTPAQVVEPNTVTVDPTTFNVTVTFVAAQSGSCVVNGSGGSTGSGGGGVAAINVGLGLTLLQTTSSTLVGLDSAVVPTYLTQAALLSIPPLAAGNCGEAAIPLLGATVGDSVAAGWPATMGAGLIGMMSVQTANQSTVQVCNLSGTPSAAITDYFRATIVRSF